MLRKSPSDRKGRRGIFMSAPWCKFFHFPS